MSFTGIHHIVIRVNDLEASARHWAEQLGFSKPRFGENPALGVKQAFFDLPAGGFVELIAPLHAEADLARALAAKGEGVHLISMSVASPPDKAAELKDQGVGVIGQEGGPYFVHPKSASGVMLGLAQAETV